MKQFFDVRYDYRSEEMNASGKMVEKSNPTRIIVQACSFAEVEEYLLKVVKKELFAIDKFKIVNIAPINISEIVMNDSLNKKLKPEG